MDIFKLQFPAITAERILSDQQLEELCQERNAGSSQRRFRVEDGQIISRRYFSTYGDGVDWTDSTWLNRGNWILRVSNQATITVVAYEGESFPAAAIPQGLIESITLTAVPHDALGW